MPVGEERTAAMVYEVSHRSLPQIIVETGIFVFIALTALVGNSCVLYVFYKKPCLRNITGYYLITLAVSDVVMAIAVMPFTIDAAACGRDAVGYRLGLVTALSLHSLCLGSLKTTCLIAINRFFCVVKPCLYRKYFKPKPTILMISGIWIFSISLFVLLYFSEIGTLEYNPVQFTYFLIYKDPKTILLSKVSGTLLFVIMPLSISAFCYCKVYRVVTGHNATVSTTLNAGPARNNSSMTREEIHITKYVLALICGFALCWIPNNIVFTLESYVNLTRSVEMIIIYTLYASSAINPLVFNIFNKPFRKQFLMVFGLTKLDVEAANEDNMQERN